MPVDRLQSLILWGKTLIISAGCKDREVRQERREEGVMGHVSVALKRISAYLQEIE